MSEKKQFDSFIVTISSVIVDKRNLFFLLFIIAIAFSIFSGKWVKVENDLTAYLPVQSETRKGLDLMDKEFVTFGTAQFAVTNISYEEAERIYDKIVDIKGVYSVGFDDSKEHYNNSTALYDITFDYDEKDSKAVAVLEEVKTALEGYDVFVSTELGDPLSEQVADEMKVVVILVAAVVVFVLLFTSRTYAEIPVLLLTFVSAAIINMGTAFLLGTISFISNSVTIVLQLALSIDYAIILCDRYKEEHEILPIREAVITALSKAIPEIAASSMTTIGGLIALLFMKFRIGPDMGINLIKAILLSILSVFLLMPGLLMLFGPLMDKSHHKSFIPEISKVGTFAYFSRRIIPPFFVILIMFAFYFAGKCPYVYGYDTITTPVINENQKAVQVIEDNFGTKNVVALVVPSGAYESEKNLLMNLQNNDKVIKTIGLSNTEAIGGYVLTDRLTPRQFSELTDIDDEAAKLLYAAYAADNEAYGKIVGGLNTYRVPLMDIFLFLNKEIEEGYLSLNSELTEELHEAYRKIYSAKLQLQGEHYSRMLVYLDLPSSGDETFAFIDEMRNMAKSYYLDGDVYVVGDSTSKYEFYSSFQRDNVVVSIISILVVLVVLLFTFTSVGMPLLLILVIQGSIWINFAIPVFIKSDLFFMSYLIVSSIQMGANIDYAIVISNRYMELKDKFSHKEAIIKTMNQSFPTIITSGTMMVLGGGLIGRLTSEATIAGIGQSLSRGTIISLLIVMFVLPQILLLGAGLIDKTSFSVKSPLKRQRVSGRIRVEGRVRGSISGTVNGMINAVIDGEADLNVLSGTVLQEEVNNNETN